MHKDKALQIIAENKKSYNAIAPDFDATRHYAWPEFEMLAPYIKEGSRILDIGCGNGRLYDYISSKFKVQSSKYVGIDQSEELIKIAGKNNPNGKFDVVDIFNLPFKDGEFDVVAGIAFLHHIPSQELREKCLKEIYRVLSPGGILFLTNWNLRQWKMIKKYKLRFSDFFFPHNDLEAGDFWINFKNEPRFYHHFGKREIIKLCHVAGFKNIKYKIGKTEKNGVVVAQK